MKKKLLAVLLCLLSLPVFSQVLNDGQVLQTGHWIYESLQMLEAEQKSFSFYDIQPMSVAEIKFYLRNIDEEKLSPAAKNVFNQIEKYLYSDSNLLNVEGLKFSADLKLNPEFYFKSNDSIPWSFDYNVKDNFLTIPVLIGFGNNIALESDMFIGISYYDMKRNNTHSNIPYFEKLFEKNIITNPTYPEFCYFSGAKNFNNWGLSAHVGRTGLSVFNTSTGSIYYNDTFETNTYFLFDAYTDYLKFSQIVVQVQPDRYMYLKSFSIRPIRWFKLTLSEGCILNSDFELRFLNPAVLLHSYLASQDYQQPGSGVYSSNGYASYMGLSFEVLPLSNWRLYFDLSMSEVQLSSELQGDGKYIPDGFAFQGGTDFYQPLKNEDFIKYNLEAVYTLPYMYIKPNPGISYYTSRKDGWIGTHINSWTGTPFGPDSLALQLSAKYNAKNKWSVETSYLFVAHGDIGFDIFNEYDGKDYTYYPIVKYRLNPDATEEEKEEWYKAARSWWLSGTLELKNQIKIKGEYNINRNVTLGSQIVYSLIFNTDNISGNTQQGFEFTGYATIKLLDGQKPAFFK